MTLMPTLYQWLVYTRPPTPNLSLWFQFTANIRGKYTSPTPQRGSCRTWRESSVFGYWPVIRLWRRRRQRVSSLATKSKLCIHPIYTEKKKVKEEDEEEEPSLKQSCVTFLSGPNVCWWCGELHGSEEESPVYNIQAPTLTCIPWSCQPTVPVAAASLRASKRAAACCRRWATGPRSRSPPSCLPHPPS